MKIAICDDDRADLDFLEQQINVYRDTNDLSTEIFKFMSGEAFLTSKEAFEIIFMDIYMAGINGIETIRTMTRSDFCHVVFTTSSREHAIEAFAVCAVHYLIKPLRREDIFEAMDRCLRSIGEKEKKILNIKHHQLITPVCMSDIIYIEVFNKISLIHTMKSNIQTYASLDALLQQLDNCFMRAQRSFIVNMNFIESILSDRLVLSNGIEIILSRSGRNELKQQYQHFLFKIARRRES